MNRSRKEATPHDVAYNRGWMVSSRLCNALTVTCNFVLSNITDNDVTLIE